MQHYAWNSAIQGWFEKLGWLKKGGPFIYAVIITIIAVIATIWIGRVAERIRKSEEEKALKKKSLE